jgi:hypothetical protein
MIDTHRPKHWFNDGKVFIAINLSITDIKSNLLSHSKFSVALRDVLEEQHNVALERLAHATTDRGRSPASPLQAIVIWPVEIKRCFDY